MVRHRMIKQVSGRQTMDIVIKPMESDSEIRGKAYVHWKSWQDTYAGLIDQSYLENHTIEKCTEIAFRWLDNLFVAKKNDKVVGFVGYGACIDESLPDAGEIFSIYVLKEYYDKKIGYALMCAALEKLCKYRNVVVWVLEGNYRAIKFYEKCGFRFDGTKKEIMLGTVKTELRMMLTK